MRCPNDETTLVMSERSGIEIDYCPTCRGVWLDRGELDKIIDRSLEVPGTTPVRSPQPPAPPQYDRYDDRGYDRPPQQGYHQPQGYQQPQSGYYKKKRKESWLSEIFD